MKTRTLVMVLCAATLLLAAGCVQVEQSVTLRPDGSTLIDVTYAVSDAAWEQLQDLRDLPVRVKGAGSGELRNILDTAMTADLIEYEVSAYNWAGVYCRKAERLNRPGWHAMHVVIEAEDLDTLRDNGLLQDVPVRLDVRDDGSCLFQVDNPGMRFLPPGVDGGDEAYFRELAPALAGFLVNLDLHLPGAVVESSAADQQGQTVSWRYDIAEDPAALWRLQQADIRAVFDCEGCDLSSINAR